MSLASLVTWFAVGRNYRGKLREYDWDWTKLNGAFEGGIRVTDIDGLVERKGRFLVLEGKPKGKLPTGQRIALEALAKLPEFTVVVIEGNPPDTITGWRVIGKQKYTGNYDEFVGFVTTWFQYANQAHHLRR